MLDNTLYDDSCTNFSLLFSFSLFSITEEDPDFDIGSEFETKNFSSAVLYHYKNDAIRVDMSRDLLSDSDFFLHNATVDARDLYKIKRGKKNQNIRKL
ncbi:MAG: hypothetical protein Ct9H90mP4_11100 [Gammaproteobacteria bacterium]|nr:MAG: hypothetical protein Ct9H90mP4_11100 [Gammaproteobacteria bacterium]